MHAWGASWKSMSAFGRDPPGDMRRDCSDGCSIPREPSDEPLGQAGERRGGSNLDNPAAVMKNPTGGADNHMLQSTV